jgi:uncharacterized 2Fe-2S/4Fe-4S cluster protein (DUF4445 family)
MSETSIRVRAGGNPDASLTDLLARAGHPVNARCGQRGLCRGCMVDLIEGKLLDAEDHLVVPGTSLRSCRLRVPAGEEVMLRLQPQAEISFSPQVEVSFLTDVPVQADPLFPATREGHTVFAADIGTTTVVVLLADAMTGEVLARAGDFSAQIRFGDNVITRIGAGGNPVTLLEMRRVLVEETLLPLVRKACSRAMRPFSSVLGGTLAGNTAMLHILAGEDPTGLGSVPFTPRFLEGRVLKSDAIGMPRNFPLHLLPSMASYLGADISAGIHAMGMTLDPAPVLLVDLGTNGEIVLSANGRLFGCATAAGPAFEGAGLSHGTRAHAGAASRIRFSRSPAGLDFETIGDHASPVGICGSAYVDFLATARAGGLLMENGRMDRNHWESLPDCLKLRGDDGLAIRIGADNPVSISEVDIAHLLQAKAAIAAGIEILLETSGIPAADIQRVELAGGFGMHVDVAHAIAIGMLPGFHPSQIRVVGNTSLAGALIALLDRSALDAMEHFREEIEVLELNLQPDFEDCYINHLFLP